MRLEVLRHIKPRIEPNAEVARRRCGRCDGAPGSLKPVAHRHDRVLAFLEASSKARAARGSKRRRLRYSTGWGQPGDDAASPGRGYPATEGTSGAAERAPLRGGTREAALSQRVPRKRRPRETRIASAAPSGTLVKELPKGRSHDAGNSSLRSTRAATRGVRADRVGAKLSPASDRGERRRAEAS